MVGSITREMEVSDLSGKLIVATPSLGDPTFYHTVAYICSHNEHGAIGLVINRPTDMNLTDIFRQMDIEPKHSEGGHDPVFVGGPVQQERGFVLHSPSTQWKSSIQINDQICVTTSRDIIHAIAHGNGPDEVLVTLGYAGWTTGQLEDEVCENAWLCAPCNPQLLFSTPPEDRWAASMEMLGFDAGKLSIQCGNA